MPFLNDAPIFLPSQPDTLQVKRAFSIHNFYETYSAKYLELRELGIDFVELEGDSIASIAKLTENGDTGVEWQDAGGEIGDHRHVNRWTDFVGKDGTFLPGNSGDWRSWLDNYQSFYMPPAGSEFNLEAYRFSLNFGLVDSEQRFIAGVVVRTAVRFNQILAGECMAKILNLTSHRL